MLASIFSLFLRVRGCRREYKLLRTIADSSRQSRHTNDEKSSRGTLKIISVSPYHRSPCRWFLFFFLPSLSPFFFSSSVDPARAWWTGRDHTCHRSPFHPRHCRARLSRAPDRSHFFAATTSPPHPASATAPGHPFLIYLFVVAVLISIRSPTPIPFLLTWSLTPRNRSCPSHGKILIAEIPPRLKWIVVAMNQHRHSSTTLIITSVIQLIPFLPIVIKTGNNLILYVTCRVFCTNLVLCSKFW